MKKVLSLLLIIILISVPVAAQRHQQKTSRAVVAVNRSGSTIRSVTSTAGTGSLISWRKLAEEPEGTTYNVYKRAKGASDYTKITSKPVCSTCLSTTLTNNCEYTVSAITPDGVEGEKSSPFLYQVQPYPNVWFDFDFDDTVIKRNDYRTKYCWPMDTDGDGEFDAVVVDRLFASAASDNGDAENQAENTASTSHKIQAYKFTGELLWTVDMGPNVNICAGHNDMIVAYDINCDGKCEVIIRSSDGTRFWDKNAGTWGKYVGGNTSPDTDDDGIIDYRSQTKRNPPFYVSIIDGATGTEQDYAELNYSELTEPNGGDAYSRDNRSDYMSFGYGAIEGHYGIAYLDGLHPSLIMECEDRDLNKTHHGYVLVFDYSRGSWQHSYTWVRNPKRPECAEFHQIRILDSDGDGCDEMWTGGYGVNPMQNRFLSTGLAHGDRFIISDIDPDRPGLEGFAIQQSALLGQCLYDAHTGERIKEWYLPSVYDVGRGACLDIDDTHKGYEILSYADEFVYDCKGEKTGQTRTGTMFEGVWWDGRLQREWLNSPGGSGWGTNLMITRVLGDRLCEFSQESSWATHGGTGTRPAFMGDIIGDWREEIILAKQNENSSTGLTGYTTNIPTQYSIYCLQQDPHYRLDCTTRGYYQHPNTGFYLGGDMPMPPLPPVFEADVHNETASGKSVMYDLQGNNAAPISISTPMSPTTLYLMNPHGHNYTFDGQGTTGSGSLIKSMQGTVTFNCDLGHTGKNIISEGTICVNGTISGSVELRARGTLSGNSILNDTITFEGALNHEGCRLIPYQQMTFNKSLVLPGNVYIEITPGAKLHVNGDLTFKDTNCITISLSSDKFNETVRYVIAECTGILTCDPSKLKTRGLDGINYDIIVEGQQLVLIIHASRPASENVLWTGAENNTWDYKAQNFQMNGTTSFVAGDQVIFNEAGLQKTINVPEMMITQGVIFDSGNYTLQGEGGLSGERGLTVNKAANVTMNTKNSDYTGPTIINGGTLTVPNFYDSGQKSSIGAAAATAGNLQLNGGTLVLSKDNMATDRIITIADTATIRIASSNSSLSLKGNVRGTGYLVKDGPGRLNFSYGGANNFPGIIIRQGAVGQGAWNATFCKKGGTMLLAGGEVSLIDNNSTSTLPEFNYVTTIEEGTTNTIVGTRRGKINGSFKGRGALTIRTYYVRCDIGASFANFEGTLTAIGDDGNFRLMTSANDLSKACLTVGVNTTLSFMQSGSGNETSGTLKIGTLQGTATDGVLGGSQSSYQAGFRNENSKFSGLLKGSQFTKVGTGKLTLTTAGHTAPITVSGGTLVAQNTSTTPFTTSTITVSANGMLAGTALLQSVTVQKGGVIVGGLGTSGSGTLRLNGNLTLNQGATLRCILGKTTGNTKINVSGKITHRQDTLVIVIPDNRHLNDGDEIQIFTTGFSDATGEVIVRSEGNSENWLFDTSALNSDGKVRVVAETTDIQTLIQSNVLVDVFDTHGLILRRQVPASQALHPLSAGIYIINGQKIIKP